MKTLRFYFTTLQLSIFTLLFLLFPVIGRAEWNPTHPDPIIEYHYSYDSVGNITSINDAVKNSTSTFTYDEVNRLTQAIGAYGANGVPTTVNYSYSAVGDITGTPSLPTDGNGNITNLNGKTIEYDYENRPIKITETATGTVTECKYDYTGQRVFKKITVGGTFQEKTFYVGNIYEVHYSSTAVETQTAHIYAGSLRVASRVSTIVGSRTFYYIGDHLGSTRMMTDALGQVVQDITYEPWGSTVTESSTTYKADYKFTGQKLDDSTGLYYYGARYYDPQLRRFITPDTIVQSPYDPQSLNRYVYVRNNPLKLVDLTGHEWGYAETGGQYDWFRTTNYFGNNLNNPLNLLTNFGGFTGNLALNALGTAGEGVEFAKQAVFGNPFVEKHLGNYSSEAVDAFLLNYGGLISQGLKTFSTYYQTAAKIKWAEVWAGSKGYVTNETGAIGFKGGIIPDILDTFEDTPKLTKLAEDRLVYRYWSANEQGSSWYSSTLYSKSGNARRYLALPEANAAEHISVFNIPAGSTVLEGQAASRVGISGFGSYAVGGGQQTYLLDPNVAELIWRIK